MCAHDTQCTVGLSCDRMIMEYTHDEYCDMLLTPCYCNSRGGTDVRKFARRYLPDANVFCDCSTSLWDKTCNTYDTCEGKTPTITSQWSSPIHVPRSTFWRSAGPIPRLTVHTSRITKKHDCLIIYTLRSLTVTCIWKTKCLRTYFRLFRTRNRILDNLCANFFSFWYLVQEWPNLLNVRATYDKVQTFESRKTWTNITHTVLLLHAHFVTKILKYIYSPVH
jgi:hypothetical protein